MTNEQLQQKIQEQLQDLIEDIAFENGKLLAISGDLSTEIGAAGKAPYSAGAKFHRIILQLKRLQSRVETMNNRGQQIQALYELRKV